MYEDLFIFVTSALSKGSLLLLCYARSREHQTKLLTFF